MSTAAHADRRLRSATTVLAILTAIGAIVLALAVSIPAAQAETLFSDNFEDSNLDGWTRSGGSWSVVTDGTPPLGRTARAATPGRWAGSRPGPATPRRRG